MVAYFRIADAHIFQHFTRLPGWNLGLVEKGVFIRKLHYFRRTAANKKPSIQTMRISTTAAGCTLIQGPLERALLK